LEANGPEAATVLVVEDDLFVREEVVDCFRESGYSVRDVASGETALQLCRDGLAFDVLMTDINLSGPANGWDVAEAFRNADAGIFVIYASAQAKDDVRCVTGSRFFRKPYRCSDILRACQKMEQSGR